MKQKAEKIDNLSAFFMFCLAFFPFFLLNLQLIMVF